MNGGKLRCDHILINVNREYCVKSRSKSALNRLHANMPKKNIRYEMCLELVLSLSDDDGGGLTCGGDHINIIIIDWFLLELEFQSNMVLDIHLLCPEEFNIFCRRRQRQ